jgi:hypothetical protein
MIYLPGGPPHIDLVDPKPDAPSEIRSPFDFAETNVKGIVINKCWEKVGKMMDKFVLIRSLVGARDEHASNLCLSGYTIGENRDQFWPSLGAVMSKAYGPTRPDMPPFVELTPKTAHMPYSNAGHPGFLGLAHSSVRPYAEGMEDLKLRGISLDRLGNRRKLLSTMDGYRRKMDESGVVGQLDGVTARAFDLLTSDRLVKALDVGQESDKVRDRYGRGASSAITDAGPDWNDQFLAARRLVEAGARCVTLGFGGWDYHQYWDPKPNVQAERLDKALSALVGELHERGLDKETSVVCWGDFGRTPRFNKDGGRDHWPQVGFAFLAGGGMRGGQVIGSTNKFGEYADERPVHYKDVMATLYHNVGLDVRALELRDIANRPIYMLDQRDPISEVV